MADLASKLIPKFTGPALDADRLAETSDAKIMTAAERALLDALPDALSDKANQSDMVNAVNSIGELYDVKLDGFSGDVPGTSIVAKEEHGFYKTIVNEDGLNEPFGMTDDVSGDLSVSADGFVASVKPSDGSVLSGATTFRPGSAVVIKDDYGFLMEIGSDDEALYRQRDTDNLNRSAARKTANITSVPGLYWQINAFVQYGQSLCLGVEAGAAIPDNHGLAVYMVGDSVRTGGPIPGGFLPANSASMAPNYVFKPIAATVQRYVGTNAPQVTKILTNAEVISEIAAGRRGELLGATYFDAGLVAQKKLWNNYCQKLDDLNTAPVAIVQGAGGQSVAQLSATEQFWTGFYQHCETVQNMADEASKTSGIPCLTYAQGENDHAYGVAAWKTAFINGIYNPFVTQIVSSVYTQTQAPMVLFAGVSPNGRQDNTSPDGPCAVDMAQLQLSMERPNFFCAGGVYQVPDWGIHLTANGSRWLGVLHAKIRHKILVERQDWKPFQVAYDEFGKPRVTVRDRVVAIDFEVPEPPIKVLRPFVGNTRQDIEDFGFTFKDDVGIIPINRIRIVFSTIVVADLARDPVGTLRMFICDARHGGYGGLQDSCPFVSPYNYVYDTSVGMVAAENITELVGKPYPMENAIYPFNDIIYQA